MTHEQHIGLTGEPRDGPQHDTRLPNALDITEYSDVEDSLYSVEAVESRDDWFPPDGYGAAFRYWAED